MHKNLMKFGRVVFELCERTDRQTNGQTNNTDLSTLQPFRAEAIIYARSEYKRSNH